MQLAVFPQDQLHKECYWVDSEGFLVELATMIYELWEIRIIEDYEMQADLKLICSKCIVEYMCGTI